MIKKLKVFSSMLLTTLLLVTSSPSSFAASERTLTLDTQSYVMAPGNIYDFKAVVDGTGLNQSQVKVSDSRNGSVVALTDLGNGKYRVTALKDGTTYIIAEVLGVHASIKVTVQSGAVAHGVSTRSISIIDNANSESINSSSTYFVGTDLPAGQYILMPTVGSVGYFQLSKDNSGEFSSVLTNGTFRGRSIITVPQGTYFTIERASLYALADAPELNLSSGVLPEGMYLIGFDIPAGAYRMKQTSTMAASYSISPDSFHDALTISESGKIDGELTLTLKAGQYLTLSGADLYLH